MKLTYRIYPAVEGHLPRVGFTANDPNATIKELDQLIIWLRGIRGTMAAGGTDANEFEFREPSGKNYNRKESA